MNIVVIPGDGIGPETMAATTAVLQAASKRFDSKLDLQYDIAGHASLQKYGATVTPAPPAPTPVCRGALAILIWWWCARTPRVFMPTAMSSRAIAKC